MFSFHVMATVLGNQGSNMVPCTWCLTIQNSIGMIWNIYLISWNHQTTTSFHMTCIRKRSQHYIIMKYGIRDVKWMSPMIYSWAGEWGAKVQGTPCKVKPNLCIAKWAKHVINWWCICVSPQGPENEGVWASWHVAWGSDHQHFPMPQASISWPFYIRYFCPRSTVFLWSTGRPLVRYWKLCYLTYRGTLSLICSKNSKIAFYCIVVQCSVWVTSLEWWADSVWQNWNKVHLVVLALTKRVTPNLQSWAPFEAFSVERVTWWRFGGGDWVAGWWGWWRRGRDGMVLLVEWRGMPLWMIRWTYFNVCRI